MKHPSRLHLPKLESPPATILAHLQAHFPQIPVPTWLDRFERGLVTTVDGSPLQKDSPYRHGITVLYEKEVPSEPETIEEETIIYRDSEILVVDKPHGMPVTPAGQHVERSLLVRLQNSTGIGTIAPMHRLDRETAGIVLFTIPVEARQHYHRLFLEREMEREYLAVAHVATVPDGNHWRVENRIVPGDPWYRQQLVAGMVNAVTQIELLEMHGGVGVFRLRPETGKKHQLRVHMMSLGFPIVGDPFYPEIRERRDTDPPLQLLAHRLAFIDPLNGDLRNFFSARQLACL